MIVILWEQPVLMSSTAKCSTEWEQSLLLMENVYRKNFLLGSECRELWQYVFLVGWRPPASLRMNAEIRNAVLLLRSCASTHFWKRSASHLDTLYINSRVTSFMQAHYTFSDFLYRLAHNHTHIDIYTHCSGPWRWWVVSAGWFVCMGSGRSRCSRSENPLEVH